MKKKELYEAPVVETYDVLMKQSLLVISNGANYSTNAGGAGGDDNYAPNESDLIF